MNELLEIIRRHKEKYPVMQVQDLVKLIYQNEFGPGHFVENPKQSMQRLEKEYLAEKELGRQIKHTDKRNNGKKESIGNGLCRYYLSGTDETELIILNRVFIHSANHRRGDEKNFEKKLKTVEAYLDEMSFGFSKEEYIAYIRKQKECGYPPVSHSEDYRKAYRPAYRVIEEKYVPFMKILAAVDKQQQKKPNLIIGIDGNAAAGKTTLAQCLMELYDGEVIHMDEFFLPGQLRTPMRMEEVGGNIHYERFIAEVVEGIRSGKAFEYRVFSCSDMNYTGVKRISNRKMLIIEGSYSMREDFREVYDCKIFLKLQEDVQKQRIMARNGKEMYEIFRDKWIPMENRYFEACKTEEICDLKVDSILGE
ncbi:MAG: hypothetical protein IJD96_05590 [Lachnospiraceae bacterium]|nr:hypothetical protein [Lachnospiraceae bacterium]